jgi:hypothetical protein
MAAEAHKISRTKPLVAKDEHRMLSEGRVDLLHCRRTQRSRKVNAEDFHAKSVAKRAKLCGHFRFLPEFIDP